MKALVSLLLNESLQESEKTKHSTMIQPPDAGTTWELEKEATATAGPFSQIFSGLLAKNHCWLTHTAWKDNVFKPFL